MRQPIQAAVAIPVAVLAVAMPDKPESSRDATAGTPPSDSGARDSAAVRPKSRSDSVIVVQHGFNHREQIITGSVIMSCLVLMLVAMNNYNPR
jgi:hypothetical protein